MIAKAERIDRRIVHGKNTHLLIVGKIIENKRQCGADNNDADNEIQRVETCRKHHYYKNKEEYKRRAEITLHKHERKEYP
jgi:hypothetical protein